MKPKNFVCTLQDRHADGRVMPNIDSQQDCELISLKEDNGKTTMKFESPYSELNRSFKNDDPNNLM